MSTASLIAGAERRLPQLARRDVQQDVVHDAVADQHDVGDRVGRSMPASAAASAASSLSVRMIASCSVASPSAPFRSQ